MFKLALDAGHGRYTSGKRCLKSLDKNETREWVLNSRICEKIERNLKAYEGIEVKRMDDTTGETDVSLSSRTNKANKWDASFYLSVHHDAGIGGGNGGGPTVYIYTSPSEKSRTYQEIVYEKFIAAVGKFGNRADGTCLKNLHVLRETKMPAVLIECGFMDSKVDTPMILTEEFSENAARGLTDAIIEIAGLKKKEEASGAQTVMKIPDNVYVQEIAPSDFRIRVCNQKKRSVGAPKYFNAGFFSGETSPLVPVGNLASDGKIITQARDNVGWINVCGKKLTTIYTTAAGICGIVKTDDLSVIADLKEAVSGVPIIVNGKRVDMDAIKEEGYSGDECYDTWHGFLGIRHGKLVYVAMKSGFNEMCWTLVALGIYDAIKLDGGGSFVLHDEKELAGTPENRVIHNIGVWTK